MPDSTASPDAEPRPPPRKRLRARKACLPCRQRKRKCDVQYPCSMCTTYGYSCQFDEDDGPTAAFVENPPPSRSIAKPENAILSSRSGPTESSNEETMKAPSSHEQGLLDPVKTRYAGLHSVMAFPRNLGVDFHSANPPRLHSFGWNCGLRPEEDMRFHGNLRDLISPEESKNYVEIYFSTSHPIFDVLDEKRFSAMTKIFWDGELRDLAFEAILAGVIALGSYFSAALGHPRELQILRHAHEILEDPILQPSVEVVCSWILRTIYLRLTTRPHRSWMASCTAIHVAEATGIHHEIESVVLTNGTGGRSMLGNPHACVQARRIFWLARHVNHMIAYEYGRSSVVLNSISCKLPPPSPGDCLPSLVAVSELIPLGHADPTMSKLDLQKTLTQLQEIPVIHPYLDMCKGDMCMALYRHFRLQKQIPEKDEVLKIITIGNAAVAASLKFAQENNFWWNTLCTTFQYVCVLLAMDTAESLSNVSTVIGALDQIATYLGSHMGREASNTAKVLLRDSMRKKRQEVTLLEAADLGNQVQMNVVENTNIDWDALLDPWFMSTFAGQDFSMGESENGFVPTL